MMPNEIQKRGSIFILSAPAGTGKTTLVQKLVQECPNIVMSISSTTRAPRLGEISGVDYHFIAVEKFRQSIKQGEFLEYVQLYGDYYGTSKLWLENQLNAGKHVFLVIDTQGALQLKEKIEATYIFVAPPSFEELKRRLKLRKTESEEVIEQRLKWAEHEMLALKSYDYLIVNDNFNAAYQALRSIVIAEDHRVR